MRQSGKIQTSNHLQGIALVLRGLLTRGTFLLALPLFFHLAQAAPSFSVIQYSDSKPRSLSLLPKDRPYRAFIFLSSKCPCSHSHLTSLKQLYSDHQDQVEFIGIHSNQSEDNADLYFKKQTLPFPVYRDQKKAFANHFKPLATPHVFLVNQNGTVLYQGGVDDRSHYHPDNHHYLKIALAQLAQGNPVEPRKTRVLGCPIDY